MFYGCTLEYYWYIHASVVAAFWITGLIFIILFRILFYSLRRSGEVFVAQSAELVIRSKPSGIAAIGSKIRSFTAHILRGSTTLSKIYVSKEKTKTK